MTYNAYTGTNDFPADITDSSLFPKNPFNGLPDWIEYNKMPLMQKNLIKKDQSDLIQAWVKKYNIPQSIIDQWNASQAKGEDQDTFWRRMKAAVVSAANTVTNTVKNDIHTIGQTFSNAISIVRDKAGQISFETLRPLKPAMVAALKRKGFTNISDSDSTKTVAVRFYNSYLNNKNSLDSVEVTPDEVNAAIQTAQGVAPLIQAIIDLFNQLKGKKDAGATLSPEQQKLLSDAEAGVSAQQTKTEASNKTVLYWVIGIVAFIGLGKYLKWF